MEKENSNLAPLFMIGGTDGSGKGLVVDTLVELCKQEQQSIFDLREYEKEYTHEFKGVLCTPKLPSFDKVKDYDIFVAAEPTHSEVGYGIRQMLKQDHLAKAIAEGFSFDRYNLDSRLTIPCRKNNMPVFKERGVESSLVYQAEWALYNNEDLTRDQIRALGGNSFAFNTYPPSHIIICHCPVEESIERLKNRDKKDDAVYEQKRDFMEKLLSRYLSQDTKDLFESQNIKVMYLDTNTGSVEATVKKIKQEIWPEIKSYITKISAPSLSPP